MATITSTPTAGSLTISGSTTATGTISWTKPTVPSGATISSCILTGTATFEQTGSKGINNILVNNVSVESGESFTINLGTSNTTTSVATSSTGAHKNSKGTVTFSNLLYTVTYTLTHTVTFKDWDGTILKTQTVEDGASATAPNNPTRNGYRFIGWDVSFTNITSNLTVTAQYEQIIYYTVRFLDWDGTVLKEEQVEQGQSAIAPSNPSRNEYRFVGWSDSYANVQSNLDITAQYVIIQMCTVRFLDWDGTVLKEERIESGYAATPPSNPSRDGYRFTGWDADYSIILSNIDINAIYVQIVYYTVTFVDWDGTVLKTQTVEQGLSATAPSNPSRNDGNYTFIGWDKEFTNVQSNITVTAQYTEGGIFLPEKINLEVGMTKTISANIIPEGLITDCIWTSNNENITVSYGIPDDKLFIYGQEQTPTLKSCELEILSNSSFRLSSYSASNAAVTLKVANMNSGDIYTLETTGTSGVVIEVYHGDTYTAGGIGNDITLQGFNVYTIVFYHGNGTTSNWEVDVKLRDSGGSTNDPVSDTTKVRVTGITEGESILRCEDIDGNFHAESIVNIVYTPDSELGFCRGLFSWVYDDLLELTTIARGCNVLDITELYQHIPNFDTFTSTQMEELANKMYQLKQKTKHNTELVFLDGDATWYSDKQPVIDRINAVITFNNTNSYGVRINKIILDIEPWSAGISDWYPVYQHTLADIYDHCQANNLLLSLCVPFWLDDGIDPSIVTKFHEIVMDLCDEYLCMNYNKNGYLTNMDVEMEYAIANNKYVVSAAECQPVSEEWGVTEDLTYYYDGLDYLCSHWRNIYNRYGYDRIGFAIHDFNNAIKVWDNDGDLDIGEAVIQSVSFSKDSDITDETEYKVEYGWEPANADKDFTVTVSDTSIATYDDYTGILTFLKNGTVDITVTSNVNSSITDTMSVTKAQIIIEDGNKVIEWSGLGTVAEDINSSNVWTYKLNMDWDTQYIEIDVTPEMRIFTPVFMFNAWSSNSTADYADASFIISADGSDKYIMFDGYSASELWDGSNVTIRFIKNPNPKIEMVYNGSIEEVFNTDSDFIGEPVTYISSKSKNGSGGYYPETNVPSTINYIKVKQLDNPKYTVTFVDWDDTVLKTETVEEGKDATAPTVPNREGYIFIGWDKSFDNVTSDLTVTAQYIDTTDYQIKIAEYKFNNNSSDLIPEFNSEFTYIYEDIVEGSVTTRTIYSNSLPTSISFMSQTSLTETNYLKTDNVISMYGMFYKCSNLTYVNMKDWNTDNLTSLEGIFNSCSKLAIIDGISDINTSQVNNMGGLFSGCASLLEININNWDVGNVTNYGAMFRGCKNLTSLDISNWDTSKMEIASGMFQGCTSLTSLDLSCLEVDTSTTISQMFNGCSKLVSLNLSGWTINTDSFTQLLVNCNSLNNIIMKDSDYNSVNKIISVLPTRTSDSMGTLNIARVNDISQVDIATAESKYWNIVNEEPTLFLGENNIQNMYIGETKVIAIYFNNKKIL